MLLAAFYSVNSAVRLKTITSFTKRGAPTLQAFRMGKLQTKKNILSHTWKNLWGVLSRVSQFNEEKKKLKLNTCTLYMTTGSYFDNAVKKINLRLNLRAKNTNNPPTICVKSLRLTSTFTISGQTFKNLWLKGGKLYKLKHEEECGKFRAWTPVMPRVSAGSEQMG